MVNAADLGYHFGGLNFDLSVACQRLQASMGLSRLCCLVRSSRGHCSPHWS